MPSTRLSAFSVQRSAFTALLLCALTTAAHALEPAEIVCLYNSHSPESLSVAQYYMHARNIPKENLIPVDCTIQDWMSESEYRNDVVPSIRKGLAERHLEKTVKCLVTVWGIPLTISPVQTNAADKQEMAGYEKQLATVLSELEDEVAAYDALCNPHPPASQPATTPAAKLEFAKVIAKLNAAANGASARVNALEPADRAAALTTMIKLQQRVAGLQGCLNAFQISEDAPSSSAAYAQRNRWQQELRDMDAKILALLKDKPSAKNRQEVLDLQLHARGLVGQGDQLRADIQTLSPDETEASFDNEVALVLAQQDYPRYRWLPNADNVEFYQTLKKAPNFPHPLMVSRIDGTTIDQITRMIDQSIKIEKTGLEGKLYLDGRGLHGTDAYSAYDADIRRAADWLKQNSTIDVVFDDTPEFFQAKNSPDCALYCGWYSVHKYLDSCQWLPGAVGYHVASFEMVALHDAKEPGWVPNLLRRGFSGTLGAVSEPYLTAFPKPSQFFPLLLSGEFTQGEVWQLTAPSVSWRVAYVGDPLYNPYKAKPRVKVETLKADTVLRNAFEILGRNSATTQPP